MAKYREYLKNQVRELLTNYGEISIIWFDFSFPGKNGKGRDDWDSENLLKLADRCSPESSSTTGSTCGTWKAAGTSRRLSRKKWRKWPEYNGKRIPWETCQTFSGSWGYYRDEMSWKSPAQLIELLVESVSKGGNLLLNVGPTARGTFDLRAQARLSAMGEWMKVNGRSVYGCTEAPAGFAVPPNSVLTWNPATNRLYVHLLAYPLDRIVLPGLAGKVKYVQFLHDASEIRFSAGRGDEAANLSLILPVRKPPVEIPVLEIYLK